MEKRKAQKINQLITQGKITASYGRFVQLDYPCTQNIYIRGPYNEHPTKGSCLVLLHNILACQQEGEMMGDMIINGYLNLIVQSKSYYVWTVHSSFLTLLHKFG